MSAWSTFVNWLFGPVTPDADTSAMDKALNDLQAISTPKGIAMSAPTPNDEVVISQSVINGWAGAVESAVTRLKTLVAQGNLPQAATDVMTQAITDLEGVGQTPTPPPPAPTS